MPPGGVSLYYRYARLALCGALVVLGIVVLVGWFAGIPEAKTIVSGFPSMKANTAFCFVLIGLGLAAAPQPHPALGVGAAACGLFAALIGAMTIIEYLWGGDFGIDQALIVDAGPWSMAEFPGRMSPLTAAAYMALGSGIALLALAEGKRALILAHMLVASATFATFLAMVGYAFGESMFRGLGVYTPIALHTGFGLVVASAAGLMTRADEGWLSGFADLPNARALLIQLLPIVIVLPLALGFLMLLGSDWHTYNAVFGFAFYMPLITATLVGVVMLVTIRMGAYETGLHESEARRQAALEELRALNDSLELQVAERTRAHEAAIVQLHEAGKMETLGRLTGGVAHDFNNLLTPIIGTLEVLGRRHRQDPQSIRMIETAAHAADRARLLVGRMLAFARRQKLEPLPIDVCLLIAGMETLLARSLGPSIRIIVEQEGERNVAFADQSQLELAILNLAVNARDAMPDGGTLTFGIGPRQVEEAGHSDLPSGNYVMIAVEDTGHGMDAETLSHAVEPFFSTKGVGKGTGLGLSMVDGLCAQLGGAMTLSSTVDLGTRVELWLPATAEEARNEQKGAPADPALSVDGSKLLLVDDEDIVRAGVAAMLVDLGYEVVQAASVREANRLLRDGAEITAVITDYLMPDETGADLIEDLATSHPDLPVLLITGHANALLRIAASVPRLSKPFKQAELAEAVRMLLNGGPTLDARTSVSR